MKETIHIEERAIVEIGERYAGLRIINPREEAAMEKSLVTYGQVTPIVCTQTENGFELIDGFKRLRACRRLQRASLTARILDTSGRASKAAMLHLNRVSRSLCGIEEALVVHSLYREDGLTQAEIGVLLGRHESWVSRRLSLVQQLDEDVQQEIRLGLLPVVSGREVARLPRGTQKSVTYAIRKHQLSTRQVAKLITHMLSRPRWEYSIILASPWEFFEDMPKSSDLKGRLLAMHRICRSVSDKVGGTPPEETEALAELMEQAIDSAADTMAQLKSTLRVFA